MRHYNAAGHWHRLTSIDDHRCPSTEKFFGAPRMPPTPLREVFAKFSRTFFENVGAIFFFEKQISSTRSIWSKNRQNPSYPRDFWAVRSFGVPKKSNFERPFTPRGWLRLASNFGKTRFRRSPTFHLSSQVSTSKKKKVGKIFWKKVSSETFLS